VSLKSEQIATDEAAEPRVWSAQEVRALRLTVPQLDLWRVWAWQAATGLLVVGLSWVLGSASARASAVYGVLAVLLPGALLIRSFLRLDALRQSRPAAVGAGLGLGWLMGLELVKVVLTVLMLVLAPVVLKGVAQLPTHWPVLVAAFVATLKVYWLALLVQASKTPAGQGRPQK
jgi:ATP synthase protein I